VPEKLNVDIRPKNRLRDLTGVATSTDKYERDERPVGRSREFTDALMRAGNNAISGIPTHMKEWGRWRP
jgi:hypothetical protein